MKFLTVIVFIVTLAGNAMATGKNSNCKPTTPEARFASETHGCSGYPVKFKNLTTGAASYLWDFGDGKTSSEKEPGHIYAANGVYIVTLTAYSSNQTATSATFTNVVVIESINVDFDVVNWENGKELPTCRFTNKTGFPNVRLIWDFGDGNTAYTPNPEHTYLLPGTYPVRLVAYTKSGCSSSKMITHSVQPSAPLLITEGDEL